MPYIEMNERNRMFSLIRKLAEQIENIGQLKYVLCELIGQYILKVGKFSRQERMRPIQAANEVANELHNRIIEPYDWPIQPQEDLKSFVEIDEKMKWILGRSEKEKT